MEACVNHKCIAAPVPIRLLSSNGEKDMATENHKRSAKVLRFFSSKSDKDMINLDVYVEDMLPEQKNILYMPGVSVKNAKYGPVPWKLLDKNNDGCFYSRR